MKTVKLVSALFIALMFCMPVAQAQGQHQDRKDQGPPPPPDPERIEEMVSNISDKLDMDANQKVKFQKVFTSHMEEVKAFRKENRKMEKEKMDALRFAFESDLESFLSKKQVEQFKSMHPPRDKERKQRGKRKKR